MKKNMTKISVDYPKADVATVRRHVRESRGDLKQSDIFRAILRKWAEEENEKRNRNKE